jgi:UDP-N-acetylmuramoyl-tripeptide--D-alanyl-D-alanine ligase
MLSFKASDAAKMIGAKLAGDPEALFAGMSYDSRTIKSGNLFVAEKGEKADGNDFVEAAFAAGASAALTSRSMIPPEGKALLMVSSPEEAVRLLAGEARKKFRGTVIGIVGSAGKTTTKDFSAKFLSLLDTVYSTRGNRNNLLGLPETIINADENAKYWVLEMGISKPGEMDSLAPVAAPDFVVFTSIRPVHTEFFPSLAAIRDEKAKVLKYMREAGLCIYNTDDKLLSELPGIFNKKFLSFGESSNSDLRITEIEELGEKGLKAAFSFSGEKQAIVLPFLNKVQCFNFAAALLVVLNEGAPLSICHDATPLVKPAAHRGVAHYLKNNILLYDDSYNSNPEALAALIESSARWNRRLVGVLGEMKELGGQSEHFHRMIGGLAGQCFSSLFCVGGEGAKVLSLSFSSSRKPCFYARNWEEGFGWLKNQIEGNDALIVKGSRSISLDKLVERFISEFSSGDNR